MSAVAHFFVAVSGSFIHERMAQLFIDIYTLIPEQIFFISFFIAYTSKNPFSRKTDTASVLRKSAIRCNEKQLIIILYNAPALPVFTPIKIPRSLLTAGDGFAVRAFG